jgi:hypothetical protein
MARLLLILAFLLGSTSLSFSQALDPLLEPHASRYSADVKALMAARDAGVKESEAGYVQKLDAAGATVTDEALKALIKRERQGVLAGLLAPANPTGLPEDLQVARRAFINGVGKATADYNKAKKVVDDAYLKVLAGLAKQARAKTSPAGLAAQVAAEKRRVTSGN